MLEGAGFQQAYTLTGGINAWKGVTASGPPEAGMVYFSDADSVVELTGLALILEEGSRNFYAALKEDVTDLPVAELFQELVSAEERHKEKLHAFLQQLGNGNAISVLPEEDPPDLMEGGIPLREGLQWAAGKSTAEVLQFSMSLETNAYDLYLKMIKRMKKAPAPEAVVLFTHLAEEERLHLQRMGKLLEETL